MFVQRWIPRESIPAREDASDLISAKFVRKTLFTHLEPMQLPQAEEPFLW